MTDQAATARNRRKVLRLSGVLGTSALAGCGLFGGGSDDETSTGTGRPTPTDDVPQTPEPGGPTDPPESSRRRWAYSLGSEIRATPAVVDGTVIYGLESGNVSGFDVQDGTRQWTYETAASYTVLDLTVDGGIAYIGTSDGVVEAFDVADRTRVWQDSLGEEVAVNGLTLSDGQVYLGTTRLVGSGDDQSVTGRCLALDAADGTQQWDTEIQEGVSIRPTVDDGTVYVGAVGVVALNAETGEERWTSGTDGPSVGGVTVGQGSVYATTGSIIHAFDTTDGSVTWDFKGNFNSVGAPALVDETLYTSTGNGEMGALEAATGDPVWQTEITTFPNTRTVVDGEQMYVGGYSLVAFDRTEGGVQWTHEVPGTMTVLTVADGVVYTGDFSGTAVAIEI